MPPFRVAASAVIFGGVLSIVNGALSSFAVNAFDSASKPVRDLLHAIHSVYQPNKVVLGTEGSVEPFALTLKVPPEEGR